MLLVVVVIVLLFVPIFGLFDTGGGVFSGVVGGVCGVVAVVVESGSSITKTLDS